MLAYNANNHPPSAYACGTLKAHRDVLAMHDTLRKMVSKSIQMHVKERTDRFIWFLICPFLHRFDSLSYQLVRA